MTMHQGGGAGPVDPWRLVAGEREGHPNRQAEVQAHGLAGGAAVRDKDELDFGALIVGVVAALAIAYLFASLVAGNGLLFVLLFG